MKYSLFRRNLPDARHTPSPQNPDVLLDDLKRRATELRADYFSVAIRVANDIQHLRELRASINALESADSVLTAARSDLSQPIGTEAILHFVEGERPLPFDGFPDLLDVADFGTGVSGTDAEEVSLQPSAEAAVANSEQAGAGVRTRSARLTLRPVDDIIGAQDE